MSLPLFRPFAGLRPAAAHAADVAAPPYDVVSLDEARALAEGRPWSFLHVSRPEIDLPEGTDPHAPEVYAKGAANLATMVARGVLARDARPGFYVYRMAGAGHAQTGIVGAASIAAYDANRVRKHEFTRPDKEDDRVHQIDAVNAQTGPVLLAHRPHAALARVLAEATQGPADYAVGDANGITHSLWGIFEPERTATIQAAFEALPALYIADGHHRSAAASRVAAARRHANPHPDGMENYESFLAVSFPSDEMRILDYNRVVRDLGGLSAEDFLARVGERFTIAPAGGDPAPGGKGRFSMYLGGRWHALGLKEPEPSDPRERLDVSLLADRLIEPVLGISDPRRDSRIDFVGGIRGLGELSRRVDSGDWAVAFALHPTSMEDLMAVAEAGEVMPPKSTWFEPKLLDGLVSNPLD